MGLKRGIGLFDHEIESLPLNVTFNQNNKKERNYSCSVILLKKMFSVILHREIDAKITFDHQTSARNRFSSSKHTRKRYYICCHYFILIVVQNILF